MVSILDQFIEQCHSNLISGETVEIQNAKDYLKSERGISYESALSHKIGYCSDDQDIPDEVCFYGKDLSTIGPDNHGYKYSIMGRIIVPIFSEFGMTVGFATRKPSSDPDNAWWNLSKPFKKGEHLYLLNKARKSIYGSNKIYIVEGYADAIILFQYGLKNVVAIMGTTLTPRKIGLIVRYCDEICICLDKDKNNAGQKGQERAIYSLREFDFYGEISVIDGLPIGEDPDSFVIKNGIETFLNGERRLTDTEIDRIYKKVQKERKK